jgi:hypothetical protein
MPMGRHIAIVGNYSLTRARANDLPPDVEIWGCSETYRYLDRIDRWFEIHEDTMAEMEYPADYYEWLTESKAPVYTVWREPNIPSSVPYPLERILDALGDYLSTSPAYLTCSPAYMLALAIYEGVEQIELFGINFQPDEGTRYAETISCIHYFVGMARGKGISVLVHSPIREGVVA